MEAIRTRPGPLNVLMIGSCIERKNHLRVIEALHLINRFSRPVALMIVGDGPTREVCRKWHTGISATWDFHQTQRLTSDEMNKAWRWADRFVHPSTTDKRGLQEGLGLVVIEAFERQVPVICTTNGGLWDVTLGGMYGTIISPDHTLQQIGVLIEGQPEYNLFDASLSVNCRYSHKSIAARLNRMVSEVLNAKKTV